MGEGLSVLQIVKEFEKQSGKTVKYQISQRRPGDAPAVWADATKAIDKIGFKATRGTSKCAKTRGVGRVQILGLLMKIIK